MFVRLKKWYYKKCLKKELEKMDDFKNDPDYYLCGEGSKQAVEIQKCKNRLHFYCSKLFLLPYSKGDYRLYFEVSSICREK